MRFLAIFGYFHVPETYQHKVLFWGIIGAIVLRAGFIVGGLALMERFHWTIYIFGLFLLGTGIVMMRKKESKYDPEKNLIIRNFRRFFPVTERYEWNRFFARKDGRLWATPLFIVLLAVESSDIIFAVDSIPAIFAITSDAFIVYTSNIFAMLGLRALYFAVSGFMQMFHFLHYGFASIIIILGGKMLLGDVFKVPSDARSCECHPRFAGRFDARGHRKDRYKDRAWRAAGQRCNDHSRCASARRNHAHLSR